MNASLPYVDLVFCLKCSVPNLTQRMLEGHLVRPYAVEGFPQHGLHAGHAYVARSVGDSQIFFLGISIYRKGVNT